MTNISYSRPQNVIHARLLRFCGRTTFRATRIGQREKLSLLKMVMCVCLISAEPWDKFKKKKKEIIARKTKLNAIEWMPIMRWP